MKNRFRLIELLLHIGVWILIFILPQYLMINNEEPENWLYLFILLKTLIYAAIFYLNYLILIPYIFYRGKKILYFLIFLLSVFFFFYISEISFEELRPKPLHFKEKIEPRCGFEQKSTAEFDHPKNHKPPPKWPLMYNNLITLFLISLTGLGLRFAKKMIETEKERKEAEKEKINTELSLLKSQIHPHFFFNTLNNIYALTEAKSNDASKAILKLSKLMRYVIYDSDTNITMLSKEIEFIKNYADLMKLRLSSKVKLYINFPDKYIDTEIHPLLFITFIENAFKYGISYTAPSFIFIEMKVQSDIIEFVCRNSIVEIPEQPEHSGLGLENVKKRLNMLYPASHNLVITNKDSVFEVNLKLNTRYENKNTGN